MKKKGGENRVIMGKGGGGASKMGAVTPYKLCMVKIQ